MRPPKTVLALLTMAKSDLRTCRCWVTCMKLLSRRQRLRHYHRARLLGQASAILPSESDRYSIGPEDQDAHTNTQLSKEILAFKQASGSSLIASDADTGPDSTRTDSEIAGSMEHGNIPDHSGSSADEDTDEENQELERERIWTDAFVGLGDVKEDDEDGWLEMWAALQRMATAGDREAGFHDIRTFITIFIVWIIFNPC